MLIEKPRSDDAIAYQRQESIYHFHCRLREFYHFVKKHCDDIPDMKCSETPKLVCFRSVRDYPPVQCELCKAGYFPLTIDYRFAEDVGRDSIKPPIKVTEIHEKRFNKMWADIKTFRLKKKPPDDPLANTIVGV